MPLTTAGRTTHFIVRYDDAVGAPAQAVAHAVLNICETDLQTLSTFLPYHRGDTGDVFVEHPIDVQIINDPLSGPGPGEARNYGFSAGGENEIQINPFSAVNAQITDDFAGFLFTTEMAEILMVMYDWDAGSSQGEALSRVLAEELHPSSAANFVNAWLAFPDPRPDYVNRNEQTLNLVRGDLDPIAYGCGIVFIYFLRYQLGFLYDQICQTPGPTLADRYRRLTGATDDPAARVNKKLTDHFGTGPISLVRNNPFPLYEGTDREIDLAFSQRRSSYSHLLASGTAHVSPFFTCPPADYPYTELQAVVEQTITARPVGFGAPELQWRINGKLLDPLGLRDAVPAPVDVPDPDRPGHPTRQTGTFIFTYVISRPVDPSAAWSLALRGGGGEGDYLLEVEVEVNETAVAEGPVITRQRFDVNTRLIVYGGSYAEDRQRCAQALERDLAQRLRAELQDKIGFLRNQPDPPPPGYISAVLRAVERIREELSTMADHALAAKVADYLSDTMQIPPGVFLRPAHNGHDPMTVASRGQRQ